MRRRTLVKFAASALAAPAVGSCARADESNSGLGGSGLDAALKRFLKLPGRKSYLLHIGRGGSVGSFAYWPNLFLFVASAYKTLVLGQYLRDIETGRLSEDEPVAIDDSVRTLGSPVFADLTGTTRARSVLEAMITHSDNTATDAATLKVGADRVRALISQAGLQSTLIPDSTRIFASYIVGAPAGSDLGWPGIVEAVQNPPGPLRPLLNQVQTLASSSRDLVFWYEQSLDGALFTAPETLTEFKRIQAMSDQIARTVPQDTPAYAKGGEASLNGDNAKSFAGQMVIAGRTPVTFCFIVNWPGPETEFVEVEDEFFAAIAAILEAVK
jgi:beta-lactamase class A